MESTITLKKTWNIINTEEIKLGMRKKYESENISGANCLLYKCMTI